MRKFGEAAEYFEFQLEGTDEIYKIPTAASMPVKKLLEMQKAQNNGDLFEYQLEMLAEYMGDVVYSLSAGTIGSILRAWAASTNEAGASLGES